ncbi:MAG: class I SAM-dependent methyltransferase, partial [Chloroflexota bacterium]
GRVAKNYRSSPVHAAGEDLPHFAKLVQQTPNAFVLDLGCGTGHTAAAVAPFSKQVIALDLTHEMLEQVEQFAAEKELTNIETRIGDAEQLPFEENTFDLIVSRYSAHHWPHPQTALKECRRVLKPNGRLILGDVIASEEPSLDTFLQTIELLRDASHVRDHSVSQWERMLTEVGFKSRVVLNWLIPIDFIRWTTRMATPQAKTNMIKALFEQASSEVKTAFQLSSEGNFVIGGALFESAKEN